MLLRLWSWLWGEGERVECVRHPKWGELRRDHLRRQSVCQVCGTVQKLEVHHIDPVHVFPEKEMDTGNLMTLCEKCHFRWGHLWDWRSWNPEVRKDAEQWAAKRISRPRK